MRTGSYYGTEIFDKEHLHFGGKVYANDFEAHYYISDIISKIISDQQFNEKCKKNAEFRSGKTER